MISGNFSRIIRNNAYWLKDGTLITIFIALNKLINLLLKYFLSKRGIDVLGETQFLLTNITFLSSLAFLGFPGAIVRFISIFVENNELDKADKLSSWLIKKVFFIGLIISLCFYLINNFMLKIDNLNFFFYISIPFFSILEIIWQTYNAKKLFLKFAIGKFLTFPLLRLIILLLLISLKNINNEKITNYHIYLSLILCILIWIKEIIRSLNSTKPNQIAINKSTKTKFLNYSFDLNIGFITLLLYENIDIYLLKFTNGGIAVGIYSIYLAITNLIDLILNPFINILQTHLAKFHKNFQLGFKNIRQKSLVLLLISIVFSLFITINKKLFFNFFHMDLNYQSINLVLLFLIDKILNISLLTPISIFLDFYKYQKYTAKLSIYSLTIKIFLCFILFKEINITNLILANIISKSVQLTFLYFYTRKKINIKQKSIFY